MEELPCLTHLLQKVSAHQIGAATLSADDWLRAHPEQIHTLHVMAQLLLNATQRTLSQPPAAQAAPVERLQQALQQVAQAEHLSAWSAQVQRRQQQREQQHKLAYGDALQQWLQQAVHARPTPEVV